MGFVSTTSGNLVRSAISAACGLFAAIILVSSTFGGENVEPTSAERGYALLTTKPYLPPDFDDAAFENLWKVWPRELREEARQATPEKRRRMAFSRYGLVERPGGNESGPALGYVADGNGGWAMNCLACHTGKVAGRLVLGSPNASYALATLTEDVRQVKLQMLKPLGHMELGSVKIPLGSTRGTTNSVMFGVALGALRDRDLNFNRHLAVPAMVHHDMDAPPLWNVARKKYLYCDNFVAKSARPLLQFVMLPNNSGATLRGWEVDYRDILAWIESLSPPKYPWEIDGALAARGELAFERVCARCHGKYGESGSYPERVVPIEEVQTDLVRLYSLSRDYRQHMQDGWLGEYGGKAYRLEPGGYVAPPLNGLWASAPYLHNGSVPTLWHLLHPTERPAIWTRRSEDGYDGTRVGLEVDAFDALPAYVKTAAEQREFFDTGKPGKSALGHLFPDELTDDEKADVLEYLKTL
ncbi:MAG: cytochrome c [Planctomycetaceae bacterium]